MLVGLDFDNTIVCYDQVFHLVAREQGLIPADLPASKGDVRDYLRSVGKEETWIAMQGYVYGARMKDAPPFPGVRNFLRSCRGAGVEVCVISHKTREPFSGPKYDLHRAARDWLTAFFHELGQDSDPPRVFFELTKQAKLERIRQEGCAYFVDDLPEFLGESGFPENAQRILFDPTETALQDSRFLRAESWRAIERIILCAKKMVA